MAPGEAVNRIRDFVVRNYFVADPKGLADDASLIDHGIIDSTGVLELISFLERDLGVRVADDELVPDNLDSIARLGAFVARKHAGS